MPALGAHNHVLGLLAKEQSNIDAFETLSASDDQCDIFLGDGDPPPPEEISELFDGNSNSGRGAGTLFPQKAMPPQGFWRQGQYQQRMRGAGTTYSASVFPPNEIHRWLKACGLTATYSASPSAQWTYAPTAPDTPGTVLSIADYRQQSRHHLRNVVATMTIEGTNGGAALITFDWRGIHESLSNQSFPSITLPYHAVIPPAAVGISCSINGVTDLVVRSYRFVQNVSFDSTRYGMNLNALVAGWVRGGSTPEMEVTFERPTRSAYDPEALRISAASQAITMTQGTSAFNRFTLNVPQAQLVAPVQSANEGAIATVTARYSARTSSPYSNDAFSLVMN